MKNIKETDLQCIEDGHNKEYHAQVVEITAGHEYVVNFQYGKIGKSLKVGTKTPQAVGLDEAIEIYTDLVANKVNKGYQVV